MKDNNFLTKRDLLTFENELSKDLAPLLQHEGASLYFPTATEMQELTYLKEEEKLFIPLKFLNSNEVLAIFLARKPQNKNLEEILPTLPFTINLLLEKLSLKKAMQYDRETELYSQYIIIERLSGKVDEMREKFCETPDLSQSTLFNCGSAGYVYLHLSALPNIAKKYGYLFAEACLEEITQHLLAQLPNDILLARVNNYDCAFFIDDDITDSRTELNSFVHNLCQRASALAFEPPAIFHKKASLLSCPVYGSYILFPQDYDFFLATQSSKELSYSLLAKVQNSAYRAKEQEKTLLPFNHLLSEGGSIVKKLTHNQFVINLGKNSGLKETMRFSVYAKEGNKLDSFSESKKHYKGELHIIEISEDYAIAEQSFIYDPTIKFEEKDLLKKLPEDYALKAKVNATQKPIEKDSLTQLYKYSDFLSLFGDLKQEHQNFALALLTFENIEENSLPLENILAESVQIFFDIVVRKLLADNEQNCPLSSYGNNSILAFIPLNEICSMQSIHLACQDFANALNKHLNQKVCIGIAEYPLLSYRSSEAIENARKAMECARLLPFPHVSLCDSIALNISADKLATQGQTFEAVQEYQSALLLDNKNALAHASLGVSLVNLGRFSEAQKSFLSALELMPEDTSLLYNLGGVCEKLNEKDEASRYYSLCLKSEEFAFYGHVKLGQLAEESNNKELAKNHYQQALAINKELATPYRQLAKIALEDGDGAKAREYLHTALTYAPHDPKSLLLLARLYLENNEDPSLAEHILAPIMTQKQKDREFWKLYVQALRLQGKITEAVKAENTLKNISE